MHGQDIEGGTISSFGFLQCIILGYNVVPMRSIVFQMFFCFFVNLGDFICFRCLLIVCVTFSPALGPVSLKLDPGRRQGPPQKMFHIQISPRSPEIHRLARKLLEMVLSVPI